MTDTIEEFSHLVSSIYRAAINPADWGVALDDIRCAIGAHNGGLALGDGITRQLINTNVPDEAMRSYGEYFHRLDYVVADVETGPVGLIRTGAELIAMKPDSEFHTDWMRRYGMTDGLFVRLTSGPLPKTIVYAAPRRSEAFDSPERVRLLDALVPHLQQALRTQGRLEDLVDAHADPFPAVDFLHHGIAIIRSDRRILHVNSAAERVLSSGDGLTVRSGRIEATRASTDVVLQRSIDRAFTRFDDDPWGGSLCCSRPSGKRPYVIHVLPLDKHVGTAPSARRAVLAVVDPELEPEPPTSLLRRLWGLTAAEADVAVRIARGSTLSEISDELTISLATVRTHLHHVFDKTDTHRQAELVRLLLTLRP